MVPLKLSIRFAVFVLVIVALTMMPQSAMAHCDGLDGPVVKAALKALESGNVNLVLIWVQEKDEAEINEAYQKTLAVRKLNDEKGPFGKIRRCARS